jgi:hypothetical protein
MRLYIERYMSLLLVDKATEGFNAFNNGKIGLEKSYLFMIFRQFTFRKSVDLL